MQNQGTSMLIPFRRRSQDPQGFPSEFFFRDGHDNQVPFVLSSFKRRSHQASGRVWIFILSSLEFSFQIVIKIILTRGGRSWQKNIILAQAAKSKSYLEPSKPARPKILS